MTATAAMDSVNTATATALSNPGPTPTSAVAPTAATAAPPQSIPQADPTTYDPGGLLLGKGSNFVVLDDPRFIPAAQATWLKTTDLVIGVNYKGESRAYPLRQIAYHHIVNDDIAGDPYLVTY